MLSFAAPLESWFRNYILEAPWFFRLGTTSFTTRLVYNLFQQKRECNTWGSSCGGSSLNLFSSVSWAFSCQHGPWKLLETDFLVFLSHQVVQALAGLQLAGGKTTSKAGYAGLCHWWLQCMIRYYSGTDSAEGRGGKGGKREYGNVIVSLCVFLHDVIWPWPHSSSQLHLDWHCAFHCG